MQKIVKLNINVSVEKHYDTDDELTEKVELSKIRNAVANALPECYALTDCFVEANLKEIEEYNWDDKLGWVKVTL
jgi:hypothetical protein